MAWKYDSCKTVKMKLANAHLLYNIKKYELIEGESKYVSIDFLIITGENFKSPHRNRKELSVQF
jgi:hypothetical protein